MMSSFHATPLAMEVVEDMAESLLFMGIGATLLYGGFRKYRTKRLIEDTPREKVRSMAAGRTELSGEATPRGDVLQCPFTEGAAIVANYEIEEHHPNDDGPDWFTVDSGVLAAPFDLDDGTGSVCIAADEEVTLHVSDENCSRYYVDDHETEPPQIRQFLEEHSSVDTNSDGTIQSLFDDRRRYTQEVIPPCTTVYVYGKAGENAAGGLGTQDQELVVGHDDATDRFIVSDMDEDTLTTTLGWSGPVAMLLGSVILTVGFYLGISTLGLG